MADNLIFSYDLWRPVPGDYPEVELGSAMIAVTGVIECVRKRK
jgi:hypothetical protein